MKKEGYYSSGQFAKMAEVSVRTIRYYDKQNILKPSYVNENGARFYSDRDLARLQQILLLKFLGFSLDDIREITVDTADYHMMKNSLEQQHKLIQDRIEQMQLVETAIRDTADAITKDHEPDWSQMLRLIHLTGMETSLKRQYQDSTNITARINLHQKYSVNKQGWFPWIYQQAGIRSDMHILELGCGQKIWTNCRSRYSSCFPTHPKACSGMCEEPSVQGISDFPIGPLIVRIFHVRIIPLIWYSQTTFYFTVMISTRYAGRSGVF